MDGIHTDTCFPSVDAGDRQGRCVVQELVSYQVDLENCRIVTVWPCLKLYRGLGTEVEKVAGYGCLSFLQI